MLSSSHTDSVISILSYVLHILTALSCVKCTLLALILWFVLSYVSFYTMIVSVLLTSDGAKMSKRKKNYPEPTIIVDKYGADAVR